MSALLFRMGLLFVPASAHAFCGFFVAGSNAKLSNNASQVAIVRDGNRTSLTMQNNYSGPPESFAMVVPVPVVVQKDSVKTLHPSVFDRLDTLSAPRLVEYWEQDPCRPEELDGLMGAAGVGRGGGGYGNGSGSLRARETVHIEAQFTVGEYEILVLSAEESDGLETWLREHDYKIPVGAADALAPYVRQQMKFFVAKVDIQKVKRDDNGNVVLSPLRVTYETPEVRLPIRLGLLNANGKQDLIVYLLSPKARYEVANYPNVFIPTNLEVIDGVRKHFAAFYAELFDAVLVKKQGRAVVTEYAWQTTSCDPCPGPPLSPTDLASLGGPSAKDQARGRGFSGGFSPWILTRLHTRYDKAAFSDDLLFQVAKPAGGGREVFGEKPDGSEATVGVESVNNFQGRYIIRHRWQGKVSCSSPRYGAWGPNPEMQRVGSNQSIGGSQSGLGQIGSASDSSGPVAAKGLASAPRGRVSLRASVRTPVPWLGLRGKKPAASKPPE